MAISKQHQFIAIADSHCYMLKFQYPQITSTVTLQFNIHAERPEFTVESSYSVVLIVILYSTFQLLNYHGKT